MFEEWRFMLINSIYVEMAHVTGAYWMKQLMQQKDQLVSFLPSLGSLERDENRPVTK